MNRRETPKLTKKDIPTYKPDSEKTFPDGIKRYDANLNEIKYSDIKNLEPNPDWKPAAPTVIKRSGLP